MMIPLPKLMRHWREQEFSRALQPATQRWGLRLWAYMAARPALYRVATRIAMRALGNLGGDRGRLSRLPLAGGWTRHRDMPAPTAAPSWTSTKPARTGRARTGLGSPPHERARDRAGQSAPRARRLRR
jgi:L-lactate dehydrogenase complex protein LldF